MWPIGEMQTSCEDSTKGQMRPFRTQPSPASVARMFSIYSNGVLIGQSALESGDPPMGVAFGEFIPAAAFASLRMQMVSEGPQLRILSGLSVRIARDVAIDCESVAVFEAGEPANPAGWEVTCFGIVQYADLFPERMKTYDNQ